MTNNTVMIAVTWLRVAPPSEDIVDDGQDIKIVYERIIFLTERYYLSREQTTSKYYGECNWAAVLTSSRWADDTLTRAGDFLWRAVSAAAMKLHGR